LKENKELFPDEIPKLPPRRGDLDFKIELEPGARPPAKPPYRLSYTELEEMKKQLKDYVDRGFIRPSTSPFGAPAFFVKKKDGTFGMVIDYRPLNKVTVKDTFPLPRAEELMETLFGKRWFTKLDLRQFFHQLRIAMGDSYKTAFVTRWGTFEWLVMPFGVSNAPPASMRLITLTMRPTLGWCIIVFINDILVYSRTLVQHVKDVKWVLDLLRANNLYVKIKKCEFFTNSTHFLGFVIDAKGIMPERLKLELIRDWPDPKDLHELQIFLGAANWVRKFVRGFASIAQPLTKALKKGMKFTWTEEMKTTFCSLKEAIINITSLYIPDPERPFEIFGDVSEQRNALGGALMQQDPCVGWLRPVAFASRTLTKEERNYPIREKELLAAIFLLKHWCPYVSETITVWTDHESLKTLDLTASYAEARGRVRRWMSFLQELGLKLKYLPGAKNILTDTLSRHPPSEKAHAAMGCEICLQTNSSLLPDEEFLQKVRDGYREDKFFRDALFFLSPRAQGQKREEPPPFLRFRLSHMEMRDGLLYYKNRLAIPTKKLQRNLIFECHDVPGAGHLAIEKTYLRLIEDFYWPNMFSSVAAYVPRCDACLRNKQANQKPFGLLQPLPVPARPYDSVSMDFVCALPRVHFQGEWVDSVLTVVDRLSKRPHWIPCATTITAEGAAHLFYDHIVCSHGLPLEIVSDRDPRWMAEFWRGLHKLAGTRLMMSSSGHPQTDGQSEIYNRTLETMLRCFCGDHQSEWPKLLPSLEFACISSTHSGLKATPHAVLYGFEARTFPSLLVAGRTATAAEDFHLRRQALLEEVKERLERANEEAKRKADQKRREATFVPGDWVLVHRKFFESERLPSERKAKLSHIWYGPFEIDKKVGEVSNELMFPAGVRKYPVVHVSYMKAYPVSPEDPPPRVLLPRFEEAEWEVDRVVDMRGKGRTLDYHVVWKGYSETEATWEPPENLKNAKDAIKAFKELRRLR